MAQKDPYFKSIMYFPYISLFFLIIASILHLNNFYFDSNGKALKFHRPITFYNMSIWFIPFNMLDRRDISKLSKPLLIAMGFKTALFLVLLIFLIARNLTGFAYQNSPISHCDHYFNAKFSSFQKQILVSQFFMTLVGLLASALGLILFAILIIQLRK